MQITPYLGLCEPVACLTHLVPALLVAAASRSLLALAGDDRRRRLMLGLFAGSVILQLAVSGLYHAYPHESSSRLLLQRLDHAAIWLITAGCFLPLQGFLLPGRLGRALRAAVIAFALVGALGQTVFFDLIPAWVGVLCYVGFGSIGTPIAVWLVVRRGLRYTAWFFAFGVLISSSALLELAEEPTVIPHVVEYHEVVHLLIVAGLACQWQFVRQLASEARAPAQDLAPAALETNDEELPVTASARLPGVA